MSEPVAQVVNPELTHRIARLLVGGYDDRQSVRKAEMNRLRDLVRKIDKGIPLDQPEEKLETKKYEKKYADNNLGKVIDEIYEEKKVSEAQHDNLTAALELARRAKSLETAYKPKMKKIICKQPIWTEFLVHIPGVAETLATEMFALMRAERFKSVSALWRYCGLHLICPVCTEKVKKGKYQRVYPLMANSQGVCPKCGRKGIGPRKMEGKSIDFNPKLRELAWKIADCLVKQKSPRYYDVFLNEKIKQAARVFTEGELMNTYEPVYHEGKNPYKEDTTQLSKGHIHKRGMRKMIKIFLQHYWLVSRLLAKEPISQPYVQAHLKHTDIITWQDVLKENGVTPSDKLVA